jgi:hypothetical protein
MLLQASSKSRPASRIRSRGKSGASSRIRHTKIGGVTEQKRQQQCDRLTEVDHAPRRPHHDVHSFSQCLDLQGRWKCTQACICLNEIARVRPICISSWPSKDAVCHRTSSVYVFTVTVQFKTRQHSQRHPAAVLAVTPHFAKVTPPTSSSHTSTFLRSHLSMLAVTPPHLHHESHLNLSTGHSPVARGQCPPPAAHTSVRGRTGVLRIW